MKKLGFMGLDFYTKNKGCDALSYSFLKILSQIFERHNDYMKLYVVTNYDFEVQNLMEIYTFVKEVETIDYRNMKKHKTRKKISTIFKKCDFVFDFTRGDSFSDIYGSRRFIVGSLLKEICVRCQTPLILCPQTIGPFDAFWARFWAKHLIKKSKYVCARDKISVQYVYKLTKNEIDEYIDVAFSLPYKEPNLSDKFDKKKVGLNISGLLWNYGYTGGNEFELSVDYQKYTNSIIEAMNKDSECEVHLIGHVIDVDDKLNDNDNDIPAIKILQKRFPKCKVAPIFKNPIEAKSYIAGMDVVIAARMHASIAAFSSGVAVIPFAYSRKVNGLYTTLDYPYYIDGKEETTERAIELTMDYIRKCNTLKKKVDVGNMLARKRLTEFSKKIDEIIF